MKKLIIKSFDKIIVVMLGMLGILNSCKEQPEKYGMPPVVYKPYANYGVSGVVTDKETTYPIRGIRIIQKINSWDGDTVYTDVKGKYVFRNVFSEKNTLHLVIEDIDFELNGGEFETQEIEVKYTPDDKVEEGDGNRYQGKFVKTQDVELEIRR